MKLSSAYFLPDTVELPLVGFFMLAIAAACAVPARLLLVCGRRPAGPSGARSPRAWGLVTLGGAVAATGLLFGALWAADMAMVEVQYAGDASRGRRLVLVDAHCDMSGEAPHVDAALHNPTDEDILLSPYVELDLWAMNSERPPYPFAFDPPGPDDTSVLFRPGATEVLHLAVPLGVAREGDDPKFCLVRERRGHGNLTIDAELQMMQMFNAWQSVQADKAAAGAQDASLPADSAN
jgi:hypothetical protein